MGVLAPGQPLLATRRTIAKPRADTPAPDPSPQRGRGRRYPGLTRICAPINAAASRA
jgi:hypothetical protein